MGSTPIGGPLIGWITSVAGARVGLGVGAASCLLAGVIGWLTIRHYRDRGTVLGDTYATQDDRDGVESHQQQTTPYDGQELDS
jgi:hypothetical protein